MEQLLTSAKSDFMLEAPLEALHEESREWLEELQFWKDECAFFYTLILKRTKTAPLLKTKQAKEVERHLIHISAEQLDNLRLEVEAHEKYLARILESKNMDEQPYRVRHRKIAEKFYAFGKEFKEMKKKIFSLAKRTVKKK